MTEGELYKKMPKNSYFIPDGADVFFDFSEYKHVLDEAKQEFPLTPHYDGDDMTEFWAKLATDRLDWAKKWFGEIKWKEAEK